MTRGKEGKSALNANQIHSGVPISLRTTSKRDLGFRTEVCIHIVCCCAVVANLIQLVPRTQKMQRNHYNFIALYFVRETLMLLFVWETLVCVC